MDEGMVDRLQDIYEQLLEQQTATADALAELSYLLNCCYRNIDYN